ncbi:MAG TPA: hypothetical protein PKC69_02250 [Chitinophagaceae bacterium]|nr:hypothetical protein [Chitinophagaceae bacterium]
MKRIAAFIIVALLATACMKNMEQGPSQREQQLYSRQWKLVEVSQKSQADPSADSSILKGCHADDVIRLSANGEFAILDNQSTCDSGILKYDAGIWLISLDQQKLLLSGQRGEKLWNITTLNDSVLQVTWLDSISASDKTLKTILMKNR